ncbi:hypothetical protein PABG_00612 [Paracoccidioides brasiliensis Pb03]|nr:hypothetical protein PABG_00612 [Paracoccidioides brasiliensis Pb03]
MGEKRKLPPRGGESAAAKRRVSEAAPKRDTTPSKRKASASPTVPQSPEPEKKTLPTKISDGSPLPTLSKPQPSCPSLREYQSYAESAVLAAALQRSRVKWLNDCIFEKYWTKPSKKKLQPQLAQNPPRESMSKLGPCSIVIEPHHFEAMLYTVRNPQGQAPIQYAPQQRPIVQYAPPNNFHQYQPYPSPVQSRQPYSPNSHTPPASTPPAQRPPPQPPQNQFEQPIQNTPPAPAQASTPHARPEGPTSHSQSRQTQSQPSQARPSQVTPMQDHPYRPPPESPQPVKTSPDPVIQMLATRAASNPELKALMRVVASSKASQAQLRTFQAHIDELNAILASRKQAEAHHNPLHIEPQQQGQSLASGPPAQNPAPPPSHQSHSVHSKQPSVPNPPPPARASSSSYTTYGHQPPAQPIRSKNTQQHPPQNTHFHQHSSSQPPQKVDPKAVVFEFLAPTPAGNHSSHSTTGDRYLFPANTILDYFPGGTTVIASFLVIKKIDPSAPPPNSSNSAAGGKGKSKKSKLASATETPAPTDTSINNNTPVPHQGTPNPETQLPQPDKHIAAKPEAQTTTTTSTTEGKPPPKPKIKEYYQPVTMRLRANNPRTLEPLARVVNPPAEVRQYMNDIMDRMERADIEYLALRLPHEGSTQNGSGNEPAQLIGDQQACGIGSKSKGRGDSGPENGVAVKQEDGGNILPNQGDDVEAVEVEEKLKEFYDMPSGIVPFR